MSHHLVARMLLQGETRFGKHVVFSHSGLGKMLAGEYELQKRTAQEAAERLVQAGALQRGEARRLVEQVPIRGVSSLEARIHSIEKGRERELIELAKKTVCELYGISRDQLDSLFGDRIELEHEPIANDFQQRPEQNATARAKNWINRRHVHNLFISGWALNHMRAAPIMAREELEKIGSGLPDLHALHSSLAQLANFQIVQQIQRMGAPPFFAGASGLRWEGGRPQAFARAVTFPILVQEMSKAIVETAFAHGLPKPGQLTEREINAFHNQTNDPAAEIIHFIAGPPAAALLGKAIGPKDALSHLAALSLFPATDLERHVTRLFDAHGNPAEIEARGRKIRTEAAKVYTKWVDGEEFEV